MENFNRSSASAASSVASAIPIVILVVGLVAIYYLYQYLYGPTSTQSYTLLTATQKADIDPAKPITVTADALPRLYEGGEFTVSTWLYINNWSYRSGRNKSILRIGGRQFDTLRIYLGGQKPKLHVRIQSKDNNGGVNVSSEGSLTAATLSSTFNALPAESALLESSPMCDLPEVDLQRWVYLTVAVNGRTADVYLDGKLSRSCVLPSFYKVDAGGYSAELLSFGGFGGQLSTTTMYDSALSPEEVYKNYMAGPEPIFTFGGWLKSMFKVGVTVSVDTK